MIKVIGPGNAIPIGYKVIDVTSRSGSRFSPLKSPCFHPIEAKKMENAWQFSKVYACHDNNGVPSDEWYEWREKGINDSWAHRYPMGKIKPEYSWFEGKKLGYIKARKQLYLPLYLSLLENIPKTVMLLKGICEKENVALWDFDGYSTDDDFETILNNPLRRMGHAFIIREYINLRLDND